MKGVGDSADRMDVGRLWWVWRQETDRDGWRSIEELFELLSHSFGSLRGWMCVRRLRLCVRSVMREKNYACWKEPAAVRHSHSGSKNSIETASVSTKLNFTLIVSLQCDVFDIFFCIFLFSCCQQI